jgi:diguanylate cyclase (GGDEF)-like protein
LNEGRGFFAGFARWIDGLPGGLIFGVALGTVALVGMFDELTGSEIDVTLLYVVPVWLGSWFLGAAGGLVLAVAAAFAAWSADVATRYYVPAPGVQVAGAVLRLVLLCAAALVARMLRYRGERESALARHDALTGLLNRRGFLEVARREIARSGRTGRPLTVALLDVDGFDAVNASRGQEAGDQLLKGIGTALRTALRAVDVSARFDGDEFAVLLPDADGESAQPVLSRMREVMAQAAIESGAGLTVSLGAVTFDRPPSSLDDLVRQPRRMLEEAKANGGDAMRHYDAGPRTPEG